MFADGAGEDPLDEVGVSPLFEAKSRAAALTPPPPQVDVEVDEDFPLPAAGPREGKADSSEMSTSSFFGWRDNVDGVGSEGRREEEGKGSTVMILAKGEEEPGREGKSE